MLKIAICDDEQPIREYLKRLVKKCTEGEIRLFVDGGELLADPTAFDLILLDISLNREQNAAEPDGMETARKIRERSDALIIFVTALREYVFEGYDVGAFHYLLKPIDEQKFTEVMDRAICQIRSKKNVEPLVIKVGGNYVRIPVDDILYAENQARKIMLHTKSKKEPYCFYEKMEVLEQKVEEGALSFTACQAIVSGNAKRIFGLGRKLAVNAEEKTDEKTEEKMVKGDQGWRK